MIEKIRLFFRKLLNNNNVLKIISLVAAILFWFIVVINVSPDYKRTVMGVPVSVNQNASLLTSLGLHVVDKSTEAVSITVTGPRNIIGRLNSSDFNVTPNLSDISKTGTYTLELGATLTSPDNRIRITKIDPSYVNVHFDTMLTKTLPIVVKVQDDKVPDGYLMQTAQASPTQITVSGPTSVLSQVMQAVVNLDVRSNTTQTTVDTCGVELIGASGKEIDLTELQLSQQNIQVTVPILKVVSVPLSVGFINVPAGFNTTNITYTVDPKTLTVAGEETQVNSVSQIILGNIDFSKLNINTSQTINIPDLSGLMNVGNVTSANVTVQLKNTAISTLNTNNFSITNAPSGYTVTTKTKQINGVKLFGPANDIANVKVIIAVIDMSGMNGGTGQYEMPVTFQVPGKTGYWVTGSYTAVVDVTKTW
jgi:YbbR domain-containing protein